MRRIIYTIAIAAGTAGCDLDLVNPTALGGDDIDPQLLVNGAIESWMTGWNSGVINEWLASDEAVVSATARAAQQTLDQTGDLTGISTYFSGSAFAELLDAREETRIAVLRAETMLDAAVDAGQRTGATLALRRARAYSAWFVSGLARRRGEQPIMPDGATLTVAEQYIHALEQFSGVIETAETPNDSLRVRALGGTARLQWTLGRESADQERLTAAIAAAEEALEYEPDLIWAFAWPFGYITDSHLTQFGTATPAPGFENIPVPANTSVPPGDMFVDADALWLIIAESHLRLGHLDEAQNALASTPLLLTNHVGLADRDPAGASLTAEQATAYAESRTAAEVQHAIDELWRENFYLRGDRNRSRAGAPIFPIPLPPNTLTQP